MNGKAGYATLCAFLVVLIGLASIVATDAAQAAEPVTIKFWHCEVPMHMQKFLRERAKAFEQVEPNVRVQVESFPFNEYFQKVLTATAGGNAPDVFWVDFPMIANYVHYKMIIPLDEYIDKQDLEDYFPRPRADMEHKGHIWALPMHQSTEAIYYSVDMFKDAGISAPKSYDDAWDWSQFLQNALKLVKRTGAQTQVWGLTSQYPGADLYSVQPWIAQNGGEVLSPDATVASGYLNGPKTVEALTFWGEMFHKHKIRTVETIPDAFPVGKAAMLQGNPFVYNDLKARHPNFKAGVMPMPKNARAAVNCGAWHIGVSSQTKHKETAWKLVNWIAGKEGHKLWIQTSGYLPARKSSYEALPHLSEAPWNVFWEGITKYAVPRPRTPVYGFLNDTMRNALTDIALGGDAQKILDQAASRVDAEMRKYR